MVRVVRFYLFFIHSKFYKLLCHIKKKKRSKKLEENKKNKNEATSEAQYKDLNRRRRYFKYEKYENSSTYMVAVRSDLSFL